MSTDTPRRIGDYAILECFAEGSTATLFKGRRTDSEPVACIKRLHQTDDQDEGFVAAFVHEVELATKLRHPNVVRVHEWGEDRGHYFLVMDLVEGPDLATLLLQHGPLAPDVVAFVGVSLARALAYIHHRDPRTGRPPLIHCDVTPHNVLVDGSGAVRLADFGVARALQSTGDATLTRERGKFGHLAPEQLETGTPITSGVDLFALGLVLWQALIGTHPYVERCPAGRSLQRWIPAQLGANRRRAVREAAPAAPAGLCDAIDQLLQPLDQRTPNAEAVVAALESHVRPGSAAALGRLASATRTT